MSNKEFWDEFNFRFNNLFSNQAPGLDAYEISLLLTLALDEIIKAYSNPKGNKFLEGYDSSPRRLLDFSSITKTVKLIPAIQESKFINELCSTCYNFPTNIICILNESLTVTDSDGNTKLLQVIPINFLEIEDIFSQPFHLPVKNKAWRLITDVINLSSIAQVFYHTGEVPLEYKMRYIKKPHPIILQPLTVNSIEGQTSASGCELPEELHTEIVLRAVELAKANFLGGLTELITVGNSSGTNIGITPNTK